MNRIASAGFNEAAIHTWRKSGTVGVANALTGCFNEAAIHTWRK